MPKSLGCAQRWTDRAVPGLLHNGPTVLSNATPLPPNGVARMNQVEGALNEGIWEQSPKKTVPFTFGLMHFPTSCLP